MHQDLTQGSVMRSMLVFAVPMILGNLLQQCYNIADTLIVGQFLGKNALAAVGSSFSLMTFLTSILLGLCMGSGALFSIRFGQRDETGLRESIRASFVLIAAAALLLCVTAFACLDFIRVFLRVPAEVWALMREYLFVIFWGIAATFLYNYFASLLRALGNSVVPLMFLAVSAMLNIILDLWFVLGLERGAAGAAEATVIAQYISGIGIALYAWARCPQLRDIRKNFQIRWGCVREIAGFSVLTCVQQSVMNLGILMVQGLVNSFGPTVMAAFAATVKIDAFAYMPVQDFGNAFSTFIAQNYGAKKDDRIRAGLKGAVATSIVFCLAVSALVWVFAADGFVCGCTGDGGHSGGHSIPAHRRRILLRYWLSLSAVWPIPGPGKAWDERSANHHFAGNPGGAGIYAVSGSIHWCDRHLVVGAHWLGAGRHGRNSLLHSPKKTVAYWWKPSSNSN